MVVQQRNGITGRERCDQLYPMRYEVCMTKHEGRLRYLTVLAEVLVSTLVAALLPKPTQHREDIGIPAGAS